MPQRERTAELSATWYDPDAGSVTGARREVCGLLRDHGRDDLVDGAALVVEELCANSVQHAGGRFAVAAHLSPQGLYLEVIDEGADPTQVRAAATAPGAPRGRGLLLVDAVSARWGVEERPDGKAVWAELR